MSSAGDGEALRACISAAHEALEARVSKAMKAQSQFLLKEIALLIDERLPATIRDPEADDSPPALSSEGAQAGCLGAAGAPPPHAPTGSRDVLGGLPSHGPSPREISIDDCACSSTEVPLVLESPASLKAVVADVRATRHALKSSKREVITGSTSRPSDFCEAESTPIALFMQVSNSMNSLKEMRFFEVFIAITILINAISIGFAADWSLVNAGEKTPRHFKILDVVFLCVFTLELVIRVVAEGSKFFSPSSRLFGWNVFDSAVVAVCVLNEVNPFSFNLSVVRMLRTLRLVSVLRVIRLKKMFRELRMMVAGIMNCGKTLLWSFCILMIVTYIYAVFIIEVVVEWLGSYDSALRPLSEQDEATKEFLDRHFKSVLWSIYTLGKAVSGGVNWGDIADSMWHVSPVLLVSFPFYIMVTVFCVLNIITAAFCEAAARTAQEDDSNALEHIEMKREQLRKIEELFQRHDLDKGGTLDWQEFQAIACDWRTQAYFTEIGVDLSYHRIQTLFNMFDFDGDGNIDINEFAQGIHHLRGVARSVDMFREFKLLKKKTQKIQRGLERLSQGELETNLKARSLGGHGLDTSWCN